MIERPSKDKAQELLSSGSSYEQVAHQVGVSERTVRRWDEKWGIRKKGGHKPMKTKSSSWPIDRRWDPTICDPMLDSLDLTHESLLVHKSVVTAAISSKNLWIQWYERSWVTFMTEHSDDEDLMVLDNKSTGLHWVDGLAGLPVLCEWLGSSEVCSEIIDRAFEYRPWQAKSIDRRAAAVEGRGERIARAAAKYLPGATARIKYGAAVRHLSQDLKDLIGQQLVTRSISVTAKGVGVVSPNQPLMGLMGRIPMFDMDSKKSEFRKFSVWDLFIGTFMSEPLEVS